MRTINILTEDYIQLETIFGENDNSINEALYNLRYQIDSEIRKYDLSEKSSADYMALRYSPIFEQLISEKYNTAIGSLCKQLYSNKEIPLSEAYRLSAIFREEDCTGKKNNASDAVYCFGNISESDISQFSESGYNVSFTNTGRSNAIKHLVKLQESITKAYDNLKSIDSDTIHEALYTLADAYILTKGI